MDDWWRVTHNADTNSHDTNADTGQITTYILCNTRTVPDPSYASDCCHDGNNSDTKQ